MGREEARPERVPAIERTRSFKPSVRLFAYPSQAVCTATVTAMLSGLTFIQHYNSGVKHESTSISLYHDRSLPVFPGFASRTRAPLNASGRLSLRLSVLHAMYVHDT